MSSTDLLTSAAGDDCVLRATLRPSQPSEMTRVVHKLNDRRDHPTCATEGITPLVIYARLSPDEQPIPPFARAVACVYGVITSRGRGERFTLFCPVTVH